MSYRGVLVRGVLVRGVPETRACGERGEYMHQQGNIMSYKGVLAGGVQDRGAQEREMQDRKVQGLGMKKREEQRNGGRRGKNGRAEHKIGEYRK